MSANPDPGRPRPRRSGGFVLGRFGGAPIIARPGWLLAIVVLAAISAPTARALLPGIGQVGAFVVGAGFGVLLLGSVLVHELAHAWTARRRGMAVHQIVLTLVGGHTEMTGAPRPGTSALVAAAGPLANVALALVGWVGMQLTAYEAVFRVGPDTTEITTTVGGNPALYAVFAVLATSNALVAGFNLLPGLPMDGGWVFEALVWRITGRRSTGTIAAAWCGRVVAIGLPLVAIGVPLLQGTRPAVVTAIWAAAIGALLWTSATGVLASAGVWRRAETFALRDIAQPAVTADVSGPLDHLPTDVDVVVTGADDVVVGYVDRAALAAVPPDARAATPVGAVLVPVPGEAVVDIGVVGYEAVRAVQEAARHAPVLVAVGPAGRPCALVRYSDVVRALGARS